MKREGEWGGEGYTSLPGSAVGSKTSIPGEMGSELGLDEKDKADEMVRRQQGGLEVFAPKPGFGFRYKGVESDYDRWCRSRRLSASTSNVEFESTKGKPLGQDSRDPEQDPRCFDGYTTSAIIRPPSCIPLSEKYSAYIPDGGLLNLNRPLPLLPSTHTSTLRSNPADKSPNNEIRLSGIVPQRQSRVLSYISTGQVSSRSRRRWVIWVGVGCVLGLGVVSAVLAGVLTGK